MAKVTSRLQVTVPKRLKLFDAATERQRLRQRGGPRRRARGDRGWTREGLCDRARPR